MERVQDNYVPPDANVISSHNLFNLKTEYNGSLKLKSRIVVHGHLDAEKDEMRAYCAAAGMLIVRLLLFLGTCLEFTFVYADRKGAFMQSGPITRQVYVRPPIYSPHERGDFGNSLNCPTSCERLGGNGY